MLNFHPDYDLTDELRLKILKDAEDMGVREAAEKNNISERAIYRWRAALRDNPANPTR